jgi:hypothetical protein
VTWALFHASGVHATVAGVLLGLVVPARELAGRFEHRWRPWSTGLAVPIFALFSAGVAFGGLTGLLDSIGTPSRSASPPASWWERHSESWEPRSWPPAYPARALIPRCAGPTSRLSLR